MEHLKTFSGLNEDINIPVNVGDTVYLERRRNKQFNFFLILDKVDSTLNNIKSENIKLIREFIF